MVRRVDTAQLQHLSEFNLPEQSTKPRRFRKESHGIAVVDQVDGQEVHVVLGNRVVLRTARKEIVVNEQNNRWECEPTARGYQVCE